VTADGRRRPEPRVLRDRRGVGGTVDPFGRMGGSGSDGRPLLTAERPAADADKPWRLHWVMWMFPEQGDTAAREYMPTHSEATERLLLKVFSR